MVVLCNREKCKMKSKTEKGGKGCGGEPCLDTPVTIRERERYLIQVVDTTMASRRCLLTFNLGLLWSWTGAAEHGRSLLDFENNLEILRIL